MKRISTLLIAATLMLASCDQSKTTTEPATTTPSSNTIPGIVTNGKWVVSYYYDNDKDETSDFAGYTFEFKSDYKITATNGTTTVNGNWGEGNDDNLPRFYIAMNSTTTKLADLSDNWVIESKSDSELKLKDDNTSKNEQLHFKKQ